MALLFESEVCGRCGGTGRYSFNQIDGSRCYGCNGKGERLTKRGAAAQAFLNERRSVAAEDVQVGDEVFVQGGGPIPSFWITVAEQPRTERAGTRRHADGTEEPIINVRLVDATGQVVGLAPGVRLRTRISAERTEALRAEALAYQETLTKQGTPRKQRRAG